ncbi:MAG TPA: hypothetical protein VIH18_11895, partial [Candidatus Binatia bacterium]
EAKFHLAGNSSSIVKEIVQPVSFRFSNGRAGRVKFWTKPSQFDGTPRVRNPACSSKSLSYHWWQLGILVATYNIL